MKYKAFYHVLMINEWESIVKEQLSLIVRSGLYDELDSIYIGALGTGIDRLRELIEPYDKISIVRYSDNVNLYEFWTLKIAWYESQKDKPFFGLYFHTKGVSWPGHPGGKYWRDYMNHYNIKQYKEAIKMLRKGYDTCGVKLLGKKDPPVHKVHYSGNFFWFKSSYVARIEDPCLCNQSDRFQAEFWIGTGDPKAATLCQDFVDYNTKGKFNKGINYVHTLAYNLVSETEKATKLLYDQNDNFEHYIFDLGFPLVTDKIINLKLAKKKNSELLRELASKYGSKYVKIENVGVSQNWEAAWRYIGMDDEDVLIGADPDEHTQNEGWVNAMGDVLRNGFGLASLMMVGHEGLLARKPVRKIEGHNVMVNPGGINWALIGMSGKFLRLMNGVPVPKGALRYGWIESAVGDEIKKHGVDWCVLTDYKVRHTDYAADPVEFLKNPNGCKLDEPGASRLLREWKNLIVFKIREYGQISFDEFLERKLRKEL